MGKANGADPSVRFALDSPQKVKAIRVRCSYAGGDHPYFHMYWRQKEVEGYTESERFLGRILQPMTGEHVLTVHVDRTIDEIRIDPDDKPSEFRICEVALLVPEENGSRGELAAERITC
jgi:hypothetical protein